MTFVMCIHKIRERSKFILGRVFNLSWNELKTMITVLFHLMLPCTKAPYNRIIRFLQTLWKLYPQCSLAQEKSCKCWALAIFLGKGLQMLSAEEPGKGLILVDEINEEITLFSKVILNVIDHLHE